MEYMDLFKLSYIDEKEYKKIYESRINNESATILDFVISGNPAFYLINNEILLLITKIMSLDKVLSEKSTMLPPIALMQYSRQTLIDEIKQTNDIENVYSTKKEIKETLKKIDSDQNTGRFIGLISKYLKFLNNETVELKTCEDIRKLYDEIALKEVLEDDTDNAPDGIIFRKDPVSVLSETGKEIHKGLYPEDKIIHALSKALIILNDENTNHLISAAVFHYMFAYIHPFYDGNGRTDRFISSYYIAKNLNHLVAYKFSYMIKKHHSQYYKMFKNTNHPRNKGDLTPFIIQFLEFILEVEKELIEDLDKKAEILHLGRTKITELGLLEPNREIADILLQVALFADEGLTATDLATVCKKSYNTVKKSLDSLKEQGVLRCVCLGNKKRYDLDLNVLIK